jgi:UDP-glucose 4-epimerase
MVQRTLVTGGCGFIGRHLVNALLDEGHAVTVLDNLSCGTDYGLPFHSSLRFLEGSVLDGGMVRRACEDVNLVFHLAGIVGMQRVTANTELTYCTSVLGTHNVLAGSARAPVVLFSSSAVYGLGAPTPVSEDSSLVSWATALSYDGAVRCYAAGKWVIEQLGRSAAGAGRRVIVIRPFNVVGPGQAAGTGVIPKMLDRAITGRPLTVFGDGTQSRSFGCVSVFVPAVLRLVSRLQSERDRYAVVNVGADQETTILELARAVLDVTHSKSRVEFRPYASVFPSKTDVRRRVPDLRKLTSLIGSLCWPSVEEILRDCIAAPALTVPLAELHR